jgi:hypothetical protein
MSSSIESRVAALEENVARLMQVHVNGARALSERRFAELAALWKSETRFSSNVTTKAMHPAYQKIIGMGEAAIPLILKDLKEHGPNDWFWALHVITDENPTTEDMAGKMSAMAEAWLQWGRNAGYLKD